MEDPAALATLRAPMPPAGVSFTPATVAELAAFLLAAFTSWGVGGVGRVWHLTIRMSDTLHMAVATPTKKGKADMHTGGKSFKAPDMLDMAGSSRRSQ